MTALARRRCGGENTNGGIPRSAARELRGERVPACDLDGAQDHPKHPERAERGKVQENPANGPCELNQLQARALFRNTYM